MDVWKDIWPLRKNRLIRMEQITFGLLWEKAGGHPSRIVVTARQLQDDFYRDGSSLRSHLEKLARVGVIRLVARHRTTGEFVIDVYNPCPEHAEAVPDSQMLLPGMWTNGVDDLGPLIAGNETQPAGNDLGGDAEGARRGEIPANKSRGTPRDTGHGEIPAAKNTQKPAKYAVSSGRGEIPAGNSPRSNDNERKNLYIYNGTTKTKDNVSNVVITAGGVAGFSPQDRPRGNPRDSEPGTIGDDLLTEVLSERFSPARQKERLVARLQNLIRDPETKKWLFGFAADVMLIHGQSTRDDAGDIFRKMELFLHNVDSVREMERREGKRPKPLGKWLNKEIHKICDAHEIITPRRRKLERAGVRA